MNDAPTDDDASTDDDLGLPGSSGTTAANGGTDLDGVGDRSLVEYLQWALFGILVLVLLIATLQFYTAATSTINTFVAPRYRPPFRLAFNLGIILACGLGLSVLVRKMT